MSDANNSFVKDGKLHIRPTLTVDTIGAYQLKNGRVKLDPCTNDMWDGCEREASRERIINPVRSARLRSINGFSFRYGRVEIVAKLPTGDWLWPAMWLLPTKSKFGIWPRSGEIDIVESRGNLNLVGADGKQLGVEHVGSAMHFGPSWDKNGYLTASYSAYEPAGFNNAFHKYQMEWTDKNIKFSVDDVEVGNVVVADGFWVRGNFEGDNIWANATKAAPFDQEVSF